MAEATREGLPTFMKRNSVMDDACSMLLSTTRRMGARRDTYDAMVLGVLAASSANNVLYGVPGVYKSSDYYRWLCRQKKAPVRICT